MTTSELREQFELAQIRQAIISGRLTPRIRELLRKHYSAFCRGRRLPKSQRVMRPTT